MRPNNILNKDNIPHYEIGNKQLMMNFTHLERSQNFGKNRFCLDEESKKQ